MITIIVSGIMVVFVFAVLCCLLVLLRSGSKKGRQVHVRVLSCEQKGEAENRLYYEMQVEFYDANGRSFVRTMQSAKKYVPGDTICCRYLEQSGLLFEEMTSEVRTKSRNNVLLFLVVFLIFVGITVAVAAEGGIPEESNRAIAYLISVLFMAVGVFGIRKNNQAKQKIHSLISLPGTQVDYRVSESTDSDGWNRVRIYHPVYEYQWGGERRRIVGPVGASGNKYRAIGKKVHILLDPHTGKAVCKEDEKTSVNLYIGFGIIGLVVFILLLALSFGVLS